MSKYKYEKEFMFSNRRLEEVQLFLENEEQPLDLLAIRDNNRNTVIHHTAYHNQLKVLDHYLKYYRKNLQNNRLTIHEIKTHTRLLLDQPNSEGYTAAHYAAYRGNISVLKLLEKFQANLGRTNAMKMGLLHLAAQGNKLNTFLHLHHKQLDLNIRDAKLSTPLHWAAYSASDKIVQYLLAQPNIQLNPRDIEGLTPLHLAVIYGNSRIVRKLLIAGADRTLRTNANRTALQIAQEKQFAGIARMLNDRYTVIDRVKILCNAKMKYKPQHKSYILPITFLVLQIIVSSLPFTMIEFHSLWLLLLQGMVLLVIAGLFISLVLGGTGVLASHQSDSYSQFAETVKIYQLCMTCMREMHPRDHHCHICKICVHQYDHHCAWINNCVGKHNLIRFNIFIIILTTTLLWLTYLATHITLCTLNDNNNTPLFTLRQWTQHNLQPLVIVLTAFMLLLALLFVVPLLCLIMVQMKNLLLGKTTYERFSKSQQSILTRQGSILQTTRSKIHPSPSLHNCFEMCCGQEEPNKVDIEHISSTTSSAIRLPL